MGKAAASFLAMLLVIVAALDAVAFTTDELVQLKHSGVSEETIVFLVENKSEDAERVLKLKAAGFRDETIRALVSADAKAGRQLPGVDTTAVTRDNGSPGPGDGSPGTAALVRIDWYMVHRGEPIRQNFQELDGVKVFIVGGRFVRIKYRTDSGTGLLGLFRKQPFPNPFVWDLEETDVLEAGPNGFACALKSATARTGKPSTDGSHFWVLSLDSKESGLCEAVGSILHRLRASDSTR